MVLSPSSITSAELSANACPGLSDKQARLTPISSSLSLGGLVKHLAYCERVWLARIEQ